MKTCLFPEIKQKFWIVVLFGVLFHSLGIHPQAAEYVLNPKSKNSDSYFPFSYYGKWGFIDRKGKILVKPQYLNVGCFYLGLARATILSNGKYKSGYIDNNGNFVIPPRFDQAGDFTGELAPVRIGRRWGYINRAGEMVINPVYQGAGEFHEGLAIVQKWSKVNISNYKKVFSNEDAPEVFFMILNEPFHDFMTQNGPLLGIDNKFGFINSAGQLVMPFQDYEMVDYFRDGFALFSSRSNWGFIDKSGRRAFKHDFELVEPFSEGLAPVKINGLWGYIDQTGKIVIKPQFSGARGFSDGIAVVFPFGQKAFKSNAIDKGGNLLFSTLFESLTDFSEGLALTNEGPASTFIDKSGKKVHITNLTLEDSPGFSDGLAIVGERGKRVYIDKKGNIIAPFEKE